MNIDEVLHEFVDDYDFDSLDDLQQLTNVDLMENIIDLGEQLSELDTPDIEKALSIIHRLRKYEILHDYLLAINYLRSKHEI